MNDPRQADEPQSPFKGKTGLIRIWNAFRYSLAGLGAALRHEDAFRQECLLALVLVPLALILPSSGLGKAMLVGSVLLVLVVELLNSAIEATVDRVSLERHLLAKFRLSATTTPKGWGLSLPESLASLLSVPAKQQTEEDKQQLARYLNAVDNKLREQQTKIAEAKKPVPEDGGVTQRKAVLARLGQPIKDDALLLQLRTDLEQSKGQLANPRLTAVQDLTWALINSPAFLFNH